MDKFHKGACAHRTRQKQSRRENTLFHPCWERQICKKKKWRHQADIEEVTKWERGRSLRIRWKKKNSSSQLSAHSSLHNDLLHLWAFPWITSASPDAFITYCCAAGWVCDGEMQENNKGESGMKKWREIRGHLKLESTESQCVAMVIDTLVRRCACEVFVNSSNLL